MQIARTLLQHYFLEVDPSLSSTVAARFEKADIEGDSLLGEWRLFTWIDRPAIWAIRSVGRTVGLDSFLLADDGLPGVIDVAEVINFPLETDPETVMAGSWEEFSALAQGKGTLFATFLHPDWDALRVAGAWGDGSAARPPSRSRVLDYIRTRMQRSLWEAAERDATRCPPLLLTASSGDADLILYGWVESPRELDRCLYAATEMTVESLAREMGLKGVAQPWPVFSRSHTELAVDLSEYERLRVAVRSRVPVDEALVSVSGLFDGQVSAELGLARGRGPLAGLKNRLSELAGDLWTDRAILGGEDVVLASRNFISFGALLYLQAVLDEELTSDPRFVRRTSLRLGLSETYGKSVNLAAPDGEPEGRMELPEIRAFIPPTIASLRSELGRLRGMKWREDLRILERMVERCVTLQKAPRLRLETREMATHTLERILVMCERIRVLEEAYSRHERADHGGSSEKGIAVERAEIAQEIRLLREHLVKAGMRLDAALTHHSRGVTALLLHPASQARGPEHFGSEIGLSLGLSAMFHAVARRIDGMAREDASTHPSEYAAEVSDALVRLGKPTVYASHESDFAIDPILAMLHVPRWALWYPTAASHLMHELGHALAQIGHFSHLMQNTVAAFAGPMNEDSCDSAFIPAMTDLKRQWERSRLLDLRTLALQITTPPREGETGVFLLREAYANEFEEMACDLVSRLYSHPPDDTWDAPWLRLCFDYAAPFAARNRVGDSLGRLNRLLGGYVAYRLLRVTRSSPERLSLAKIEETAVSATRDFVETFCEWAQSRLDRQDVLLPQWIADSIKDIRDRVEAWNSCFGGPLLPYPTRCGSLLAFSFQIPLDGLARNPSAYKSILTWRNTIRAGWDSVDCGEIVDALADRRVPTTPTNYPERLPALLAYRLREEEWRVTPSHRVALAFYLYDLRLNNY